jgi:hypothetical protein
MRVTLENEVSGVDLNIIAEPYTSDVSFRCLCSKFTLRFADSGADSTIVVALAVR